MSERLTDERLASFLEQAPVKHTIDIRDGVDEVLHVTMVRSDEFRAIATELRSRRARDLTAEERKALRLLRLVVKDGVRRQSGDDYDGRLWPETALAVLDKLLATDGKDGR